MIIQIGAHAKIKAFLNYLKTSWFKSSAPMRGNFRVLCPCVRRKFVYWDVPAAYWVSPERRQFRSTTILKKNYHREGSCVLFELQRKGGGRELKLHRLTADKKLRKVRCSPLSDTATGQKSDSMFATKIPTALFYTILFTLFRTEFFQYPDAFKYWDGGVYLKRIHNKITKPMRYHYCFYATMRHAA